MAHDSTRSWPTGKGPNNTSIPGAAWLELLDGQAFPVVGAGAMVWNGTVWVPVSTQNRLPVEATLTGHIPPIWGADISERPPADAVEVGQQFILVNENLDAWISNGTEWVVI